MKNKKLLSSLLAASMLASAFPALAAYSTSKFDEATRAYFYTNKYDSKTEWSGGYDMEIVADPDTTAADNKVLHITDKDGSGSANNSRSVTGLGFDWSKFESKGVTGEKSTISSVDMYLPSGLLTELSEKAIRVGFAQQGYWQDYMTGMTVKKTADKDTFTLTYGDKTMEIAPNTWFNVKVEFQYKKAPVSIYINDTLFNTVKMDGWHMEYFTTDFSGIYIKSDAATTLTTGFYLDNATVYQYVSQPVTLNVANEDENVSRTKEFTASFGVNVSASDYEGKIKLTPTGGKEVAATVTQNGEKGIKFSFGKLAFDTEYTLTMDSVVNGEVLIPAQTVTFTTEHDSRIDTRNYIYQSDYSKAVEKGTLSFTLSQITNPTDATQKVMKATAANGTGSGQGSHSVFAIGPMNGGWADTPSYTTQGVKAEKDIVCEASVYLPTELLAELEKGYKQKTTVEGVEQETQVPGSFWFGIPSYGQIWTQQSENSVKVTKTANADTFTLTFSDNSTMTVAPNTWFDVKYTWKIGNNNIKVYINDELKASQSFSNMSTVNAESLCMGIKFLTKTPMTTGFYVDNASIYQYKDVNYTLDVADGETDVAYKKEFVANFEAAVTAEAYEGKITATAADGKAIKATVTQNGTKSLKFSFAGLAGETEYTLNFDAVTVGEAAFPAKSIKFTTGVAPRVDKTTTMFSYDMSTTRPNGTSDGWGNKAKLEFIDDPTDSTNKVVAYTFEEDSTQRGVGRMDISPLGVWDGKGDKTIYSYYGMKDDKSLYASGRFYLTSDALAQMPADGSYKIGLGCGGTDENYTQGDMIFKKSADGKKFVLTTKNATKEIAPDTWFELKWVNTPGTNSTVGYFNGEVLDESLDGNTSYLIKSDEMALGVRIVTPNGTHLTKGILADDVAVYQMENAVGISKVETDLDNGKLLVDFATNPLESELSKVTLKYNGVEVANALSNPKVKANGYTVSFDIDYTTLALSSEYTVAIPSGFKDVNGQKSLAVSEKTFTTPKSTTVYIDSKTVSAAPSATGAKVDITLGNASSSKSAWVVMAVYGKYNELIALDEETVTVEKGAETPVSLEVAADCSAAEEVRVYVWDSPEAMNPLQKNEIAWTK